MKVVPLGANVVIRRLESDETTAGGIVLPESAREKPQQGRVLSVGDGRVLENGSRHPLAVKEGDRVVFRNYSGTDITVEGQELLVMEEGEILAVLE